MLATEPIVALWAVCGLQPYIVGSPATSSIKFRNVDAALRRLPEPLKSSQMQPESLTIPAPPSGTLILYPVDDSFT